MLSDRLRYIYITITNVTSLNIIIFWLFVTRLQVVSIVEGADGKINYVFSQPGAQAAVQPVNLGNSVQVIADADQYPHLQRAVNSVIQIDPSSLQNETPVASPKKGS